MGRSQPRDGTGNEVRRPSASDIQGRAPAHGVCATIYVRTSTTEQAEARLDDQERACRDYARRRGYAVVETRGLAAAPREAKPTH